MKRALLCLLLLLSLMVGAASAEADGISASGTCGKNGDNLVWKITTDYTLIISGNGEMEDYTYNSTNNVVELSAPWSKYYYSEVIIEDGVTSVGDYAFYYKSSLGSVQLPEGLSRYGNHCFGKTGLREVTIPRGATVLEAYCFAECGNLLSVSLPEGLINIDDGCFSSCSKLCTISLPDSLRSIGSSCFMRCTNLDEITLPSHLESVGGNCFMLCTSLNQITIPASVKSMGYRCFYQTGLRYITFLGEIPQGDQCFEGCNSIQSVKVPNDRCFFGENWFKNCTNLPTSVKNMIKYDQGYYEGNKWVLVNDGRLFLSCAEPDADSVEEKTWASVAFRIKNAIVQDGVSSLGDSCFAECDAMVSISLPDSLRSIGEKCFYKCSSLERITIPSGVQMLGANTFWGCSSLKSVYLPNGLVSLGDYCFSYCRSLQSITIPNSVTSLGKGCFQSCGFTNLKLPNSIIRLTDFCFEDCKNLTEFTIPDSVIIVGSDCFADCIALTSITFPDNTTSFSWCFKNCTALTKVVMPNTDITMGYGFQGAENLSEVVLSENTFGLQPRWFTYCHQIPDSVKEYYIVASGSAGKAVKWSVLNNGTLNLVGSGDTDDWSRVPPWYQYWDTITRIRIQEGITRLGDYCFYGAAGFQSIPIPNSVTSLGAHCFSECTALTEVAIPNCVESIGYSCFEGCTAIKNVELPGELKYLEGSCFSGCSALESVVIPETVTGIGGFCFYECEALAEIAVPNSVTSIDYGCFAEAGIQTIYLSGAVRDVPYDLFSQCRNLRDIYFGCSEEAWQLTGITVYSRLADVHFQPCEMERIAEIAGTCVSDGYTEGMRCYICGGIMEEPQRIAAHPELVTAVAQWDDPTGEDSNIAYWHCRLCDKYFTDTECLQETAFEDTFLNPGHALTYIPAEAAKCLSLGNDAYWYCRRCAGYFADKNAEIPLPGVPTLPAKGHSYDSCGICVECGSVSGTVRYSGTCNAAVSWQLYRSGVLRITGNGALPNYTNDSSNRNPWAADGIYRTMVEVIIVDDGISDIGNYAFSGLNFLKEVRIFGDIDRIGTYAFTLCTALQQVSVMGNVDVIDEYAFASSSLQNISFSGELHEVRMRAFYQCSGLKDIQLPHSVESIGTSAFEGCVGLQSFVIPRAVTEIAKRAFNGCSNLKEVFFEGDIPPKLDENAFYSLSAVVYVPTCGTRWADAFTNMEDVGNYNIEWRPVLNHQLVIDAEIQPTCTQDGLSSGKHCDACGRVFIEQECRAMLGHSFHNYVCTRCNDKLGNSNSVLQLPSKLAKVESEAFYGINAQAVVIPASVKELQASAFSGCQNLHSVVVLGSPAVMSSALFGNRKDITIYCLRGSSIMQWAQKNGMPLELISDWSIN